MRKQTILFCAAAAAAAVLAAAGLYLKGRKPDAVSAATTVLKPGQFDRISIDVRAADVIVETGEDFSLLYRLHNRERVEQAETEDGTLFLRTAVEPAFKPEFTEFRVVITVPEEQVLSEIRISSVAGSIRLKDVRAEEAFLETVAGEIEAAGSILSEAEAENRSGEMKFEGTFGALSAESVSGDLMLSGNVTEKAKLETVSGKIRTEVNPASVQAESHGGVRVQDENQGRKFRLEGGEPRLELKSVSGKIEIREKDDGDAAV